MKKLNIKQKRFCQAYITPECFGNATKAYMTAYFRKDWPDIEFKFFTKEEKKRYNSASVSAFNLLRNTNIKDEINRLLDKMIKDEVVDREMVKVILQNDELHAKVAAIREYNKLKKRVSDGDVNLKFPQNLIDILNQAFKNDGKQGKRNTNKDKA